MRNRTVHLAGGMGYAQVNESFMTINTGGDEITCARGEALDLARAIVMCMVQPRSPHRPKPIPVKVQVLSVSTWDDKK